MYTLRCFIPKVIIYAGLQQSVCDYLWPGWFSESTDYQPSLLWKCYLCMTHFQSDMYDGRLVKHLLSVLLLKVTPWCFLLSFNCNHANSKGIGFFSLFDIIQVIFVSCRMIICRIDVLVLKIAPNLWKLQLILKWWLFSLTVISDQAWALSKFAGHLCKNVSLMGSYSYHLQILMYLWPPMISQSLPAMFQIFSLLCSTLASSISSYIHLWESKMY